MFQKPNYSKQNVIRTPRPLTSKTLLPKKKLPKLNKNTKITRMKPIKKQQKQNIQLSKEKSFAPLKKLVDYEPDPLNESMVSMNASFYGGKNLNKQSLQLNKEEYEDSYSQVLQILTELQKDKTCKQSLQQIQNDNSLLLATETRKVIEEWEYQSEETQQTYKKETLILGIINLFFDTKDKIRFEVFKTCLIYFYQPNVFFQLIQKRFNDEERTNEIILNSYQNAEDDLDITDFSRLFLYIIKQGIKLSKHKENDMVFINNGIFRIYFKMITFYLNLKQDQHKLSPYVLHVFQQIFKVLKNICGTEEVRKYFLSKKYLVQVLSLFDYLFANINDKNEQNYKSFPINFFRNPEGLKVLCEITGLFRNLVIDKHAYKKFIQYDILDRLCTICEKFDDEKDIIINTVKTLAKLSVFQQCCYKIFQYKQCMKILVDLFVMYKTNLFITIRLSYILGNMTSHIDDMRDIVYFDFKGFTNIYESFVFYFNRQIGEGKNEQMNFDGGKTYSSFEFHKQKQDDNQTAITKLIRLKANLFTLPKVGKDLMTQQPIIYKDMLKKLTYLLQITSMGTLETDEQILCILSLIANVTYYEKESNLQKDKSLIVQKTNVHFFIILFKLYQLLYSLAKLVIQVQNEEICCESLRVLCNIVKDKRYMKPIVNLKILEAVVVLLNHNQREIVYFSLGILINMMLHAPIKKKFGRIIFQETVKVLNDCTINDVEIISCCLKVVLNTFLKCQIKLQEKFLNLLDEKLTSIADDCDIIISEYGDTQPEEIQEIFSIRKMINQVINNTPEITFDCPANNCNRKFKTPEDLQKHIERRHSKSNQ